MWPPSKFISGIRVVTLLDFRRYLENCSIWCYFESFGTLAAAKVHWRGWRGQLFLFNVDVQSIILTMFIWNGSKRLSFFLLCRSHETGNCNLSSVSCSRLDGFDIWAATLTVDWIRLKPVTPSACVRPVALTFLGASLEPTVRAGWWLSNPKVKTLQVVLTRVYVCMCLCVSFFFKPHSVWHFSPGGVGAALWKNSQRRCNLRSERSHPWRLSAASHTCWCDTRHLPGKRAAITSNRIAELLQDLPTNPVSKTHSQI